MSDDLETMLAAIVARVAKEREQADAGPTPNPLAPYRIDWATAWDEPAHDDEWLIEPLIARGRGHALYAGAKTGKSLLMLEACAALSTGRPVLNRPASDERVPTLYVDFEMTLPDVLERLGAFGYDHDDEIALAQLNYILLPSLPPLDTIDGGRVIVDAARDVHAELVVIDTTARAVAGKENEADTYRALYRHTGQLLKEAGIAYVRLDHAGKDLTQGQRGSSGKNDDVDVVWQMVRRDGGFRMTATHRRMSWVPAEFDIGLDEDQLAGTIAHTVVAQATAPEGTRHINEVLDRMGAPVDISKRAARDLLKKAAEKCTESVLQSALRDRKNPSVPPPTSVFDALIGSGRSLQRESPGHDPVPPNVPARPRTECSGTSGGLPLGSPTVPHQETDQPPRTKRGLY